MTSIAWDGRILAADSQSTTGTRICEGTYKKLHHPPNKGDWKVNGKVVLVIALTGAVEALPWVKDVLVDGLTHKSHIWHKGLDFTAMVIDEDLTCWTFFPEVDEKTGEERYTLLYWHAPMAIGSGGDICKTAMFLGKTATEAVGIAKALDIYTGGEVFYHDTSKDVDF